VLEVIFKSRPRQHRLREWRLPPPPAPPR
jgi:hypothetical protein